MTSATSAATAPLNGDAALSSIDTTLPERFPRYARFIHSGRAVKILYR